MTNRVSSRGHWTRRELIRLSLVAGAFVAPWPLAWAGDDPTRVKKRLIERSATPYNAEPSLDELVKQYVTPLELFYVRNHGPLPDLREDKFALRVEGLVEKPGEFTLAELSSRFAAAEVEATLTCAGNRREEFNQKFPDKPKVGGVMWGPGAIGHAKWRGCWLADLLRAVGIKPEAKHIWFEGADPIKEKDGSEAPFGGSIPVDKALRKDDPRSHGAILATEMNGQRLLPEHGFPVRALVPGYIGARSVKWLTKIVASDRPSPNHYLAEAYKLVQTADLAEAKEADPIYEFPINAAVAIPANGAKVKAGTLEPSAAALRLSGYALPTGDGGGEIGKVEVRIGDRPAVTAKIASARPDCWSLWTADVDLPAAGKHRLQVTATDSVGNVQPARAAWNLKGYLYNAPHQVSVTAE